MQVQKSLFKILVTVGTTEFEDLVKFTDSQQFIAFLKQIEEELYFNSKHQSQNIDKKNQTKELQHFKLIYQIGKDAVYIPRQTKFSEWFRLSDKISSIYKQADMIICHGGAGTLLQNLKNQKILISIANDTLAGNHQIQLIEQLSKENYILGFNSVKNLSQNLNKVKQLFTKKKILEKYPKQCKNILNQLVFENN